MTKLIEQAIGGHWGERCAEHQDGCPVCDAWREYDNLVMDNKLSNKLFLEELTHTRADPVIRAEMTKLIFRRELK
jgi:hypothetical protein